MSKKKVLCVGLVCLDIISLCDGFPKEDSDERCLEQRWQRGGNASNTATVLSILGSQAEYVGTIANSFEKSFLVEDMRRCGVLHSRVVLCEDSACPTSVVLINVQTGSRTIVHANRNLPEYRLEDFAKTDLIREGYSWIHFEGRRTVDDICQMIEAVNKFNLQNSFAKIMTSVEIEKARPEMERLHGVADVTFIGKDYARYQGKSSKEEAVMAFVKKCKPSGVVIAAWGDEGAAAAVQSISGQVDEVISVPAHCPPQVVDTLGAGDTFNAACIHTLVSDNSLKMSGSNLKTVLSFACKVAGEKCGMQGLEQLKHCHFRMQ